MSESDRDDTDPSSSITKSYLIRCTLYILLFSVSGIPPGFAQSRANLITTATASGTSTNARSSTLTPTPTATHAPTPRPTPTATATPTPIVITNAATNVASFSATLNGSLNPRGSSTNVYFQYGRTTSYGHTTVSQTRNGDAYRNVSTNISDLSASSMYHFRAVAHNGGGMVFGTDRTFTTLSPTGRPIVSTQSATLIATSSATLNSRVDPHGLTTTVYFEYGTTANYGLTTPIHTPSGNTYVNVAVHISGLTPSTIYHFRTVAANDAGTVYGSDRSFTTLPKDESVTFQNNIFHDGSDPASPLVPPLTLKWRRNFSASGVTSISYPLIAQGRVFVTTSTRRNVATLMALDAQTGATIWSANILGPNPYSFVNAAYDSGKVFVVDVYGAMKAFDAATGALLWSVFLPNQRFFVSPPTAANGIVYTGGFGNDATVYAVNEMNGALVWTMDVYGGDHSSPAVVGGKVFVSYAAPQAYAFNATTGHILWNYGPCGEGGGGTTPVVHAGQVYVRDSFCTPEVYGVVLNANTGGYIQGFNSDLPPAFFGNLALFYQRGVLVAVRNGFTLWSFAGDGSLSTAPLVVNNTIYIGSDTGVLYGLNASGQQVWSTQVGAPIPSPDEIDWFITTGLGAGDGLLVVPTASTIVAYGH